MYIVDANQHIKDDIQRTLDGRVITKSHPEHMLRYAKNTGLQINEYINNSLITVTRLQIYFFKKILLSTKLT